MLCRPRPSLPSRSGSARLTIHPALLECFDLGARTTTRIWSKMWPRGLEHCWRQLGSLSDNHIFRHRPVRLQNNCGQSCTMTVWQAWRSSRPGPFRHLPVRLLLSSPGHSGNFADDPSRILSWRDMGKDAHGEIWHVLHAASPIGWHHCMLLGV